MAISDRFLTMIESKRSLRYTMGGVFSKNMRAMKESIREMNITKQVERKIKIADQLSKPGRKVDKEKVEKILREVTDEIDKYLEDNVAHGKRSSNALGAFRNKSIGDIPQLVPAITTLASNKTNIHAQVRSSVTSGIQSQATKARQRLATNPAFKSRIRKYAGLAGVVAALTLPIAASI